MWKCVACGKDNQDNRDFCWSCTTGRDGSPPRDPQAFEFAEKGKVTQPPGSPQLNQPTPTKALSQSSPTHMLGSSASGFASALKIFGIIDLIAGVIGGLVIFSNSPKYRPYYPEPDTRPYYFAIAFAIVFQGVFMFVLCNVIAEIAEDVRALRRGLSNRR